MAFVVLPVALLRYGVTCPVSSDTHGTMNFGDAALLSLYSW